MLKLFDGKCTKVIQEKHHQFNDDDTCVVLAASRKADTFTRQAGYKSPDQLAFRKGKTSASQHDAHTKLMPRQKNGLSPSCARGLNANLATGYCISN